MRLAVLTAAVGVLSVLTPHQSHAVVSASRVSRSCGDESRGGAEGSSALSGRTATCEAQEASASGWPRAVGLGRGRHGWERYDSSLDGPCTIDRVRASELSFRSFTMTYKNKKPVVLTDLTERNLAFRRLCERERLLEAWGDTSIVLSTANTHSYDKHVKTLREYVTDHLAPQRLDVSGDRTLYWFGDNNHSEWASHFDKYVAPPFIPESAAVALSFGIGGPHSGVPLHIHGPGFSETIVGRKRWWLSPPKPKPKFDPNATALEWAISVGAAGPEGERSLNVKVADDDSGWVHTPEHYKGIGGGGEGPGPGGVKMFECTVGEGEAVYFPDGWWHATLNLDQSVFMSSFVNYRFGGGDDPDELAS